jgi:hypothetical protein
MHTRRVRGVLVGSMLAAASCFQPTDIPADDVAGDSETDGDDTGQEGQGSQDSADASASQEGTASAEGSADDDETGEDPTTPTTADPTADASDDDANDSSGGTDPTAPTSATDSESATDPSTTDPTAEDTGDDTGRCIPQCGVQECGDDPVCGMPCAGCDLGETCLDAGAWCGTELGQPDDLGFSGDVNPNVLFGHRFTIAESATVRRLGVIAAGIGEARLVLYEHDGSGPGLLVAESDPIDLLAGNTESEVSPVAIDAGTYWIGIVVQDTAALRRTANGDDSHELFYAVLDYGAVMPASLGTESIVNELLYNLYVVVDDDD